MRESYIRNYTEGTMLRASLDLLWHHVSGPPSKEEALTMTEWGPFYLTHNNAPYVPAFIRAADRALYHATNVWRQLAKDLSTINHHVLAEFGTDARMQTANRAAKYEIEAFLWALVSITEANLIGNKNLNRLGQSQALGESLIAQLRTAAHDFDSLGYASKWHDIRNSATHLNPDMYDWGFFADIRKTGEFYHVVLEGIYGIDGVSSDLVAIFTDAFDAFVRYITYVRDALTQFAFLFLNIPQHNTYQSIFDPLGNMIVGFGREGYDFRHFPQTASDFVGPLKPN